LQHTEGAYSASPDPLATLGEGRKGRNRTGGEDRKGEDRGQGRAGERRKGKGWRR